MKDPDDAKKAVDEYGQLLDDWDSYQTAIDEDSGELYRQRRCQTFTKMCDDIENIFNISYMENGRIPDDACIFERTNEKQKDGTYSIQKPVPSYIRDFVKNLRKKCGIATNFQILKHKDSRFFIHFDDNRVWINETAVPGKHEDAGDIWNENDTEFLSRIDLNAVKLHNEYVAKRKEEIKNSIYESESYTADRIIEVIFNYFVKNGKIKPAEFLEKAGCKRLRKNGEYEYNTYDGKTYSYIDFKDLFLTINTHEG